MLLPTLVNINSSSSTYLCGQAFICLANALSPTITEQSFDCALGDLRVCFRYRKLTILLGRVTGSCV